MATNIPNTIPELIAWCNAHAPLWTTNAAAIGLTPAQATAFSTLVSSFTSSNDKAQIARLASKDATMNLQQAIDAVRITGGAYVNLIKAFAETTHNPAVYGLSGVSPSDPPGTVLPPVAPTQFGATINADGSLNIKWKVSQPAGVTNVQYLVFRRLAGQMEYTMVSSEGSNKSFTDQSLPFGVDRVEYIVQPKRGNVAGPQSNVFAVQFGSVMGGGMSIAEIQSVPHAEPMKIAA